MHIGIFPVSVSVPQGALLLTEVLKERDAQIEMKNSKLDAEKIREEHLLRLQQRVMMKNRSLLKFYDEKGLKNGPVY